MKVGNHARENLASIVARKKREIQDVGLAMWGYGGNTCHPTSRVQPFAQEQARAGRSIILAMHPMTSRHFAEPLRAKEFSSDGFSWESVSEGIDVFGSRFALCLKTMDEVDTTLNLASTRVAIGPSKGKVGSNYVRGRVDKACLEVVAQTDDPAEIVQIKLVAELVVPFAVFLKN